MCHMGDNASLGKASSAGLYAQTYGTSSRCGPAPLPPPVLTASALPSLPPGRCQSPDGISDCAEMLITILTRDVIDWLGLMVLVMLTFVAAMWFLLGADNSSASMFDGRFRNWYTSLQSLFQVVLESTQLDQTLAVENGHPQIAWYERIAPVHRLCH